MKLTVFITAFPSISLAFIPSVPLTERSSKAVLAMHEMGNDKNTMIKDICLRPFGTMLVASSLVFNPGMTGAIENPNFTMFSVPSSSLQVAENIKVMDMSLPSYGLVSDPNSNQDVIEFVKETKPDKTSKKPVEKRERRVAEETREKDVLNSYKSRPVFTGKDEVSIEEKKKEKELKKAEKKTVKKGEGKEVVVKAEKKGEGIDLKDVKIVEMGMPSYDDSTATKQKSVFAL